MRECRRQKPSDIDHTGSTQRIVQVADGIGQKDSAADSSQLVFHSKLMFRSTLCPGACKAIESDLEAFSPGRVAAHGGHSGLAKGERAFSTFIYILLVQRAGMPSNIKLAKWSGVKGDLGSFCRRWALNFS